MDETSLRALLEQAVADEPPAGPIVASSVAAGLRLRRRRRVRAIAAFAAFAAVIVATGVAVPGLRTGPRPKPASAVSIPPTLWVTAEYSGGPVPGGAVTPITAGPAPAVLAITPDGKTLYVADVEGTVTPISVATDTAGPPVTVAQNPDEIVITPDSKRAYVLSGSGPQDGTVTPIVTATNTAGTAVTIAGAAYGRMVLAP